MNVTRDIVVLVCYHIGQNIHVDSYIIFENTMNYYVQEIEELYMVRKTFAKFQVL